MKRRVVITGMGVVTALGEEVDQFWGNLLEGKSGVHELSLFDTEPHKVKFGGDIPGWDPGDVVPRKDRKRLDRFTQFALVAATKAVEQAGLDFSKEDPFNCGAIIGSGVGGLTEMEEQQARLVAKGAGKVSAFCIPKLIVNAASGHVSIQYGLRGPNFAIATACASATNAMGEALRSIRYGDADVIITGGSEAACTQLGLAGFANMKALSERHDDPQGASRPFDGERDGFVLSEGAGIVVFEELEHARARGATLLGEVLGYGLSADGSHITMPDPAGAGAARAMSNALRDAGVAPEQVGYINAHGTSTPLGDKAETKAIKSVYGDHAYQLNVSSTKSQLGHLLGASGGVEIIASVKAVATGICPPTINQHTPDPECDLNYTPNEPQQRPIKVAMSNSFGFGG
ncbi:MAG: beta-ketoacyl-ACP synthase II, partial [Planctomycetota bacterium]